jgi:hypothetical protein
MVGVAEGRVGVSEMVGEWVAGIMDGISSATVVGEDIGAIRTQAVEMPIRNPTTTRINNLLISIPLQGIGPLFL